MDAQDLQDVECEGFLDSGFRRNDEKKAPELQRYHHKNAVATDQRMRNATVAQRGRFTSPTG